MPRVTVIVPAHDAAAHIGEALASVQAQGYEDWEAVVADDASSDDTGAIVAGLGDPRITVVRSERQLGPAGARNLALEHAGDAELIALLDADDRWLPNYLERQVGRYDGERGRGGRVGLVACNARLLEGGRELEQTYYDLFREVEPVTLERVLRRNFVFVSALVPRAVGEEVGWFSTEVFGTEDHDLWIRILERGYRAVLSREVLAVYRRSPGSVSSSVTRQGANNLLTYERALRRGNLTSRQRRIVRSEIRYNRAMELIAGALMDREGSPAARAARLARRIPLLLGVALTRPAHWGDWVRALRASRAARRA